jgi:hypothetical protein
MDPKILEIEVVKKLSLFLVFSFVIIDCLTKIV